MPVSKENPFAIAMTHDELEASLGEEAVAKIREANFVLVPREWREQVFKNLSESRPE